jgi:hypothetical protein
VDTILELNINAFRVLDELTNEFSYGCDQKWFSTEWQRRAGCGPSVASNLYVYMTRDRRASPWKFNDKCSVAALMEETWKYVTPTERGIPETTMFCEAVDSFARSKGLNLDCVSCDIPEEETLRPSPGELLSFLEKSLSDDSPVAFLNLCNGEEENLDSWHWVTIVSVERRAPDEHVLVRILDEGRIKNVDLTLWLETTKLGGGFVRLAPKETLI